MPRKRAVKAPKPKSPLRIYIATSHLQRQTAETLAHKFREDGYQVVSTWHKFPVTPDAQCTFDELLRIGQANRDALKRANVVFALLYRECRETYVEIGMAVRMSCDIVWVDYEQMGPTPTALATVSCGCTYVTSLQAGYDRLAELDRRGTVFLKTEG